VKEKNGKLESEGVYAPSGVNPNALSPSENVCILTEHSIYVPALANWTEKALTAFEASKAQLFAEKEKPNYKIVSKYEIEKKSIKFLGKNHQVSGTLINEFIHLYQNCGMTNGIGI
jgi:hypothetical protein